MAALRLRPPPTPPLPPGWPEEVGGRRTEGARALLTPLPPPFWRGLSQGLREGLSPTHSSSAYVPGKSLVLWPLGLLAFVLCPTLPLLSDLEQIVCVYSEVHNLYLTELLGGLTKEGT